MSRIVSGRGGPVVKWLDSRIFTQDHFPEDTTWIALIDECTGEILGATCFTDYRGSCISLHFAGAKRGWLTRRFIQTCFNYVFNELGCRRAVGLVRKDNLKALITDIKLGFTVECLMRKADDDGQDMYLLSLLREECKWLPKAGTGKEKANG